MRFFCFIFLIFSSAYGAQLDSPPLEEMMSLEDQKTTGVIRLTKEQKEALAKWLVKHGYFDKVVGDDTIHALKIAMNVYEGKILMLSDNSVYEIAPDDRNVASQWLSAIPIKVSKSTNRDYPFVLTNLRSHISIKAKQGVLN